MQDFWYLFSLSFVSSFLSIVSWFQSLGSSIYAYHQSLIYPQSLTLFWESIFHSLCFLVTTCAMVHIFSQWFILLIGVSLCIKGDKNKPYIFLFLLQYTCWFSGKCQSLMELSCLGNRFSLMMQWRHCFVIDLIFLCVLFYIFFY